MGWIILAVVVIAIALLYSLDWLRFEMPGEYDENRDFPDISSGWHIFADGNMWCAVGPNFENLQESLSGFGYTQREAHAQLLLAMKKEGAEVQAPSFEHFTIHWPENANVR